MRAQKKRVKSEVFTTWGDMGSIKIFNNTMSLFFGNKIGDGGNSVAIYTDDIEEAYAVCNQYDFLGHFTVKVEAYLSEYDCSDTPIYTFERGRWFVFLKGDNEFKIVYVDDDIYT